MQNKFCNCDIPRDDFHEKKTDLIVLNKIQLRHEDGTNVLMKLKMMIAKTPNT